MLGSEGTCLDLVAVVPVAVAQAFDHVSPNSEPSRLPLPQHMKVLMQQQLRIVPEVRRGAAQQDTATPRRGSRTKVQPRVPGMLDHSNPVDRLFENLLQR